VGDNENDKVFYVSKKGDKNVRESLKCTLSVYREIDAIVNK